jgi:lysophospholipase L1-like esterase
MGEKLMNHKFSVIQNPNGILFNPFSIADSIQSYIQRKLYDEDELFYHHELWGSWDHHTRFSNTEKNLCLQGINDSQKQAHEELKKTNWLILTLGSAFAYQLDDKRIVANCHKVPTDKFTKKLFSSSEIIDAFNKMIQSLKAFNPNLNIIFTISPVRHLRDGFIENNRSKANLITAVATLTEIHNHVHYFPAYELIIDDLRDYRFFAEDMVHPNYQATQYVWEKFMDCCIEESDRSLMKEISIITMAKRHRAFNPQSNQHKVFLQTHLNKTIELSKKVPYLDFTEEINYFSNSM